ncbi:hypothetical protein ACISK3_06715 [Morganella morganii]
MISALFYSDDLTSRLLTEWRFESVIVLSQGQLRYIGSSAALLESSLLNEVFDVEFRKIEMDGYSTVYAHNIIRS